jgi:hypothetical protein
MFILIGWILLGIPIVLLTDLPSEFAATWTTFGALVCFLIRLISPKTFYAR